MLLRFIRRAIRNSVGMIFEKVRFGWTVSLLRNAGNVCDCANHEIFSYKKYLYDLSFTMLFMYVVV